MHKFVQDFSIPAFFAGFITFLVGISVSSVLVIQAAQDLGANSAQITSWFWALGIGIGICGLILSWKFKYPITTSWSTAGLALIIASASSYSLYEAIGAFLICGLLTAILGFLGVFTKILQYIPQSLTSAMLAGILLKFGIAIFTSMQTNWGFILSLLTAYILAKRFSPRYSIVITVLASIFLIPFFVTFQLGNIQFIPATPVFMSPSFTWAALFGIALPLFVINTASQYLPGLAMIKSYGYEPNVKHLIGWTGLAQTILSPFGCFAVNISVISAAISLDDQAHPDRTKRYIAGMSCGFFYILMGVFAATLTSLLFSFPTIFITALAGIALFGTIGHNIALAFHTSEDREAALLTFLFSASGIQFFGIGSAFWGLLFGLIVYHIFKVKK